MILPTKHISKETAILGVGAVLLKYLEQPQTITSLWDKVKKQSAIGTFERFILALDFLYLTGIVDSDQGIIHKRQL